MMVGEHEIMVVVLLFLLSLFGVFIPISAHSLLFLDWLVVRIYLNLISFTYGTHL